MYPSVLTLVSTILWLKVVVEYSPTFSESWIVVEMCGNCSSGGKNSSRPLLMQAFWLYFSLISTKLNSSDFPKGSIRSKLLRDPCMATAFAMEESVPMFTSSLWASNISFSCYENKIYKWIVIIIQSTAYINIDTVKQSSIMPVGFTTRRYIALCK